MSRSSRRVVLPVLLVLAVLAGVGLFLFQPWKAFTDTTVEESLPGAAVPAASSGPTAGGPSRTGGGMPPAGPRDLAKGRFVSHEHDTGGSARTVRLADGSRVLRFEDLKTSEGPDVRVYLSTRDPGAVKAGLADGAVELGRLKGNLGNQNYPIPADIDLTRYRSAVIWCARFSVSFGAAGLAPVKG
ncbi:DM13 domain-containing protein [Streptomyces sp. NPDC004111]|uniref:DM13 domain-containing protein n=1 Tax=Streptomyces sp. NPDC004111 TaxID=3364690 RepID=UPI00368383C3